ncbi:M3 family metallopeptidase [Rhodobiaceae bacterium]|nr:M3 family metallopeptidase [Rhodobiaceae bacterium]
MENPFYKNYKTQFEIPPFSEIEEKHFMPAYFKGMEEHNNEIEQIIQNTEKPSFENVIIAMERSGELLDKVNAVFFNLSGSATNKKLQEIEKEISPKLSQHYDSISLNPYIFKKVSLLWEDVDNLNLSKEERKILEETYKRFIRSGALLEGLDKDRYADINQEISKLSVQFSQNLLAETNNFEIILSRDDLKGLPEDIVNLAKEEADNKFKKTSDKKYANKYIFTSHRSSMYPFLTYSERRDLREKLYTGYIMRGDNDNEYDNKNITSKIASLRVEKANILGFETHAHYVLDNTMAKTPEAVYELLNQLWEPALSRAKNELQELQKFVNEEGQNFKIASWDWWYYSEKVRKDKYNIDEEELKNFFTLDNTIDGIFKTANKLFGLTFEEKFDIELYHPDARIWQVKDKNGSHLGLYIGDYYTRSSKRGGAWMSTFKDQSNFDGRERPIVINVCNFPPPSKDKPSLLSFEHVTTLFHEFGHGLHGLLTNTHYRSLSGTSVSRDFVEFPSQVLEHWASEPELLKSYAKHYKTGEVISDELIDKMKNASKFNQGFANTEYLAATYLDMDWHSLVSTDIQDTNDFERKSLEKIGLIDEIVSRYRTTYFQHIFTSSYSAGYYSYIWAAVLDSDAFAAFKESGDIYNQGLANKYREYILEKGGTENPMELYQKFRGSNPNIGPLLEDRGLN